MAGCSSHKAKDFVFDEYKKQLEKKALKIDSVDKDGLIYITVNGTRLKVCLDNLRRDFARDNDTAIIAGYVNSLNDTIVDLPSSWYDVKDHIYVSLFPSGFDFTGLVNEQVTKNIHKVYVYTTNTNFIWISDSDLIKWGVSDSEVKLQSAKNGDSLLSKTTIAFDTIENRRLGFFDIEDESLKAVLLFAPSLKERIRKDLGYPFYAVIPVRDFCYLFSEKDYSFFAKKLGPVVLEEYEKSSYQLTTEILKFSDKGVEAIGQY